MHRAQRALEMPKGGEPIVTFTDLIQYFRVRFGVEEGQTMAEYGVVLAVITWQSAPSPVLSRPRSAR